MKTVEIFKNIKGSISVRIIYPHWSSKKPVTQVFTFINDEKGIKDSIKSLNKFILNGYKYITK